MLEEVILVDVEDCGFDVIRIVLEQKIFSLLDELKVETSGCVNDITISD